MKKTISIIKLVAFSTIITLVCSNSIYAQKKG